MPENWFFCTREPRGVCCQKCIPFLFLNFHKGLNGAIKLCGEEANIKDAEVAQSFLFIQKCRLCSVRCVRRH